MATRMSEAGGEAEVIARKADISLKPFYGCPKKNNLNISQSANRHGTPKPAAGEGELFLQRYWGKARAP